MNTINDTTKPRFVLGVEIARKLERERNMWKTNHDNQLEQKRIKKLISANFEMRDALEQTLTFRMEEMPSSATLGQRMYLCLPTH